MVRVDFKVRSGQIYPAFVNSPDDCQTFQFNGGVVGFSIGEAS